MAAPAAPEFDPLDDWDEPPRLYFSGVEVLHLLASVVVLTVAFSLILSRASGDFGPQAINVAALLRALPYAALTVVPAFILHELAHKVVAQRRDMFAEFRANFYGLVGGLILTELSGLLFAIPGAVVIYGAADKRDAGVISIVGPGVNLVLGYGAMVLHVLFPRAAHGVVANAGVGSIFELVALMNAILAAFNMLPVPPLDGSKVWKWSKLGFAGAWLLVVALFLFVLGPVAL